MPYRIFVTSLALAAGMFAAPAMAQGACDRAGLESLGEKYIQAQTDGMALRMPMGNWVVYNENFERSSMSFGGVLATPLDIDWHRIVPDETTCNIYVQSIIADPANPYVLATMLSTRGGNVTAVDVITTTTGDWLFDAAKTLEYASAEDWGAIPEDRRNSRAELQAAADAYLDLFKDKSVDVPWGTPCARLEGGIYTGRGQPDDSCDIGVPDDIDLAERRYVIDPALGAVAVFLRFGGPDGLPDAHVFRVEDSRIRYIHTITNCGGTPNCGFPPLAEMLAQNPDMQP